MDHTRHIGIFNASDVRVTLIGAGGIGAITGIVLAKMGVGDLVAVDMDFVSEENLPTQFYFLNDLNRHKTTALADMVLRFSDDTYVYNYEIPWTELTVPMPGSIVISAVDSINTRKDIWKSLLRSPVWSWYIDARMGAEVFQASIVRNGEHDWYDKNLALQDESQIADDPCTSKATIYTGAMAAGHIGSIVRKIITGDRLPKKIVHDIFNHHIMAIP